MDFSFSEEQTSIRDLARGILEKELTLERLKETESGEDWFDRRLWSTLAEAGLFGITIPAELGGMGFGLEEMCVLLHEVGRAVAPIPVLPTLVLGAIPIAELGTPAQKQQWLPAVVAGTAILTGALVDARSADPATPATLARRDGHGWILDGEKVQVPAVHLAQRILVPASTDDGVGLFLVDPQADGIRLTRSRTSTGEPLFTVGLSRARVADGDVLGEDVRAGAEMANALYERALVATCAMQVGVSEKALEITAGYVRERVQFGVPIGSFQAVQHRSADGYIDVETMRWVTWRAAWRLSAGLPATRDVMVAKFWAAEGGARTAASAQHLHGGIGVDLDYPIHRYFLWSRSLELSFGAATPHLARLGRHMARTGPQELS